MPQGHVCERGAAGGEHRGPGHTRASLEDGRRGVCSCMPAFCSHDAQIEVMGVPRARQLRCFDSITFGGCGEYQQEEFMHIFLVLGAEVSL